MTSVWVVWIGEYEDKRIVAICTNLELAEAIEQDTVSKASWYDAGSVYIEEVELDTITY